MSLTKVSYAMITGAPVNIQDYGADATGSTDSTTAIQAAADAAFTNGQALYIPAGTFKITDTVSVKVSIIGEGPRVSIIKNYGTNDALDLSQSNYYTTFQNFSVDGSGNVASRDGISLYDSAAVTGNNVAYSQFFNVYSRNNGRHGLYHRQAWATRYEQCQFTDNGGLGVYVDTQSGDSGSANGVSFFQCDSRGNGGTTSGFGSDAGGVKINGAAGVYWYGGIVESNNGFAFYVGNNTTAVRNVVIDSVYFEYNGWDVAIGGTVYVFGGWHNVVVQNCWIAYGAKTAGQVHYCFNVIASTDGGNFVQKNNTFVDTSTGGTANRFDGTQFQLADTINLQTTPTFKAYQNATVSVSTGTPTKLPLNTQLWDTNNNYDHVTNYRFTATVPGYYQVNGCANYFTPGTNGFVSIYKNGAEESRGAASDGLSANVSDVVYLNGISDYIELYLYQSSGGTVSYNPTAKLTYFSACQVR